MKKSWMTGISLVAVLLPGSLSATTFICIADGAVGVSETTAGDIHPSIYNHEKIKFIQTDEDGDWVVKELGNDSAIFNDCSTEYYCEHSYGFAGVFWRQRSGMFTAIVNKGTDMLNETVVSKGRCTKLD